MKALLALTTLFILAAGAQAKADHLESQSFLDTVKAIDANPQAVSAETVLDTKTGPALLNQTQVGQLAVISKSQGEIWGDTILEGDYQADGKTQVDRVEALKVEGNLVAYRITYSERAWDTSTCTYPANTTKDALSHCEEGRIEEASFVSPDLSSWTRDPKGFASFVQK